MDFAVTSEAKYYKKRPGRRAAWSRAETSLAPLAIERPLNIKNSEGLKKIKTEKNETSHATYHDSSKTSDNLFEAPSV